MKFRTLLLGAAASFAVVGGAQAADLAVAAPGGMCASGFMLIPGTGTCLGVGGHVRADLTWDGSAGTWDWKTHEALFVIGETPDASAGAKVTFVADSSAPGAVFDGGYFWWNGVKGGWGNSVYETGGVPTDAGMDKADGGKVDYFSYTAALGSGSATGEVSQPNYADGSVQGVLRIDQTMGGLSLKVAAGVVGRTSGTGFGVDGQISGAMGPVTLSAGGAYSSNADGFSQNGGGAVPGPSGTKWTAFVGAKAALGGVWGVALGWSYNSDTTWQAGAQLNQAWNANLSSFEEVDYDSALASVMGHVRVAWGFNGG